MICPRRRGNVIGVLAAAQTADLAFRFGLEMALLAVVAVAAWRWPGCCWSTAAPCHSRRGLSPRWPRPPSGSPRCVGASASARALVTSSLAALAVGNAVLLVVWNQ